MNKYRMKFINYAGTINLVLNYAYTLFRKNLSVYIHINTFVSILSTTMYIQHLHQYILVVNIEIKNKHVQFYSQKISMYNFKFI